MRKLSNYVEIAATEYWQETGKSELDSLWIAEFFQDSGVMDDYPRQGLIDFFALVQKALTVKIERAEKQYDVKTGEWQMSKLPVHRIIT